MSDPTKRDIVLELALTARKRCMRHRNGRCLHRSCIERGGGDPHNATNEDIATATCADHEMARYLDEYADIMRRMGMP